MKQKVNVPIWEKKLLTLEECNAYTGIGVGKLKQILKNPGCDFVVWIGAAKFIVRDKLDKYLEDSYSL